MEINKLIPCDFSRTQQAKCTLAIVSDVQRRITVAASAVAARQSQQQQQRASASICRQRAPCRLQMAHALCRSIFDASQPGTMRRRCANNGYYKHLTADLTWLYATPSRL